MKKSAKQIEAKFKQLSAKLTEAVAAALMFSELPKSITSRFDEYRLWDVLSLLPPNQKEAKQKVYDLVVDQIAKVGVPNLWFFSRLPVGDRRDLGVRLIAALRDRITIKTVENLGDWVHYAGGDQELIRAAFLATKLPYETWEKNEQIFEDHFSLYVEMCARAAPDFVDLGRLAYRVHINVPDYSDPIYQVLRECYQALAAKIPLKKLDLWTKYWGSVAADDPEGFVLGLLEAKFQRAELVHEFLQVACEAQFYANRHQNVGSDIAVSALAGARATLPNMDFDVALEVLDPIVWGMGSFAGTLPHAQADFCERAMTLVRQAGPKVKWLALLSRCGYKRILEEYRPELLQLSFQKLQKQCGK